MRTKGMFHSATARYTASAAVLLLLTLVATVSGFRAHLAALHSSPVAVDNEEIATLLRTQPPRRKLPPPDLDALRRVALMGIPPVVEAIKPPTIEDIPETQQTLDLRGVFSSEKDAESAALITVNGGSTRYFIRGDEITPGTTLYSVAPNAVTLHTDSGFEKLVFKKVEIWTAIGNPEPAMQSNHEYIAASPPPLATPRPRPQAGGYTAPERVADQGLSDRLAQIRARLKR